MQRELSFIEMAPLAERNRRAPDAARARPFPDVQ